MKEDLTLHLLQWEVVPGDVEKNLKRAEDLLKGARLEKGDVVVLPEMFPSGFSYNVLEEVSRQSGEVVGWMSGRARHSGVAIAGSLAVRAKEGVANSMVFVDCEGKTAAGYDKIHLFPGTGEDKYFTPGRKPVAIVSGEVKLGLAICFDLRFPELSRQLCLEGVQVLLVCAQWPMARIGHFHDLVRVRAMENQMFVAACNSCGKDAAGMHLGGRSMVADPSGEIKGALGTDEGVLSVRVELGEVARVREEFPVLKCRRGDIFGGSLR